MKTYFENIIKPKELERLFSLHGIGENNISIGELVSYDTEIVKKVMLLWCKRVDNIVEMDKEVFNQPSRHARYLLYWRGFTFEEAGALFNPNIAEEQYPFYPIFNQLRRNKGGINFEKQRYYFMSQYEYDSEDYVRLLCENGFEPLLSFFLTKRAKLSAFLPHSALLMHTYIMGPTGSGKSVLMRTLLYRLQKKYRNYSIVLIDPHGDLAESVKTFGLNKDHDRLIYIDPFFRDGYTPTFNPFQINDTSVQNLTHVVEQNILAYEEILSREGGKVTEAMVNMLEKCLYFLLKRPYSTILDLQHLLDADPDILEEAKAVDPFFNTPYEKKNNRTREGLLFRISRLLNSPVLKNFLVGNSTFNLEQAINSNKVVIFNLGGLGEMTQGAVGKLLIASIKSMVRKRKKGGPKHTFLVVDEAHNFVTGSFEYILSQLRGFGLHSIFATQYIDQLESQAKTVKENSAIKIVASEDSEDLRKMIKIPKDEKLGMYEFFLKVRHRSILKFKSPSFLIDNPGKYELSQSEEQSLDTYQLKSYYKLVQGESDVDFQPGFRKLNTEVPATLTKLSTQKPPFDLFIDDNIDDD